MRQSLWILVGVITSSIGAPMGVRAAEAASSKPIEITVHKSPTCGCCGLWEKHLEKEGFKVISVVSNDTEKVKDQHAVPRDRRSCHTGIVGGYFIEGHVPAETIRRLLKEKPKNTKGLAVPGMPIGSPGMEVGDRVDPYVVYRIDSKGYSSNFESFPKK